MKKLLAITVIFALVAGAAFAQVSGGVEVLWDIVAKDGSEPAGGPASNPADIPPSDDITTRGALVSGSLALSGANDEGTYGGKVKIVWEGGDGPNYSTTVGNLKWDAAFAWWQPIEQFKFFLGQDGDGMFNTANLARWGHHKMPRGIAVEDWDAGDYFIGNWDEFGAAFIITPMEALAINLSWNIPGGNTSNWGGESEVKIGDWFEGIQAQVSYNVDSVGKFFVTYRGKGHRQYNERIGFTYQSASFVEGLSFELAANYEMTDGVNDDDRLRFGVGVHFTKDAFGIKFRAMLHPTNEEFLYKVDLMPFYDVGFGTIFLNFRVCNVWQKWGQDVPNPDNKLGWHVNPYLSINIGNGDFRIGALFEDHDGNGDINIKVPVCMVVNF